VPSGFGTGETTVTVVPEDDASASIRIAEAVGTISGTVTDAETNASLAEIDVVVKNGTEVVGTTITGSEGTPTRSTFRLRISPSSRATRRTPRRIRRWPWPGRGHRDREHLARAPERHAERRRWRE